MGNISNNNKMLEAVLLNKELMELGQYNLAYIPSIEAAMDSDNLIVGAVARIIKRVDEDGSENAIYKEVNDYLKRKV